MVLWGNRKKYKYFLAKKSVLSGEKNLGVCCLHVFSLFLSCDVLVGNLKVHSSLNINHSTRKCTIRCVPGETQMTVNVLKIVHQSVRKIGIDKQCRPRSDCSFRSSLIWIYTVCHSTKYLQKELHKKQHLDQKSME